MTAGGKGRLAGHGLLHEGRVVGLWGWGSGPGVGRCSCGEESGELPTTAARQRWHRAHKAEKAERAAGPQAGTD